MPDQHCIYVRLTEYIAPIFFDKIIQIMQLRLAVWTKL